jgi:hypothetical protein
MVKVIKKDGNDFIEYVWEIDETKPKCYKEGNSYKFNSVLLQRIKFPSNNQK